MASNCTMINKSWTGKNVEENGHGTIPTFIRRDKRNPQNSFVRIVDALAEYKPQTWDNLLSVLLNNLNSFNLAYRTPGTATFGLTTAKTNKQTHQLTFQTGGGRDVGRLNFLIPTEYYESWNPPWAEMYFLELSSAVSRKLFSKFLLGQEVVQYELCNSIWCHFWRMFLPSSTSFYTNVPESHFGRYNT
jgi:hypothetical protein